MDAAPPVGEKVAPAALDVSLLPKSAVTSRVSAIALPDSANKKKPTQKDVPVKATGKAAAKPKSHKYLAEAATSAYVKRIGFSHPAFQQRHCEEGTSAEKKALHLGCLNGGYMSGSSSH